MNDEVRAYADAIDPAHRPLFDRIRRLILDACPEAEESISYGMPTFKVAKRRLYLGAWKHGVSMYGWQEGRDGGFTTRHPHLRTGKGTLQLHPEDAAAVPDEEFRELAHAALAP